MSDIKIVIRGKLIRTLFLFIFIFPVDNKTGLCQPLSVTNFDGLDYNAASQNWSVNSGSNGITYFANHDGLLTFDGTAWQLHKLPDQSIMRAVLVSDDSLIYTSGYMELGFWKPDEYGILKYCSLVDKANSLAQNIEFWNIAEATNSVYFQAFSGVLCYQDDTIYHVELPGVSSVMKKVNNKILVAIRDLGIYEIQGHKAEAFFTDPFFRNKLVRFIIPYKNDQILLGTAHHGIYICDGKELIEWMPSWHNYFTDNDLNRGLRCKNGSYIIGTILNGIMLAEEGKEPEIINADKGLLNNTILGIDTDKWGNIWLAMDYGISFISNNNTSSFSIEEIPGIGAVYSTAVYQGQLYLGTNQGLFVKPFNSENNDVSFVPGTQGQVWDCRIIDRRLWIGHNQGTFLIDGNQINVISGQSGGFSIKQDIQNDFLIQCTYSNLVKYTNKGKTYISHLIKGFYDLIRYIEIDYLGNLWASHMHLGIYKITTDDNRDNITRVKHYGEETFGKEYGVHVFKVENQIVFTTGDSLFTYDDLADSIIAYDQLNNQLGRFARSHRIVEAPHHNYWFIGNEDIGLVYINNETVNIVKEYPASLFNSPPLVDDFENIHPISEKTALLCLQNGIAHLDASDPDSGFLVGNFTPVLREFEIYTNRGRSKLMPLETDGIKINHNFHNTHFRFSFPYYSSLPLNYQYRLEGLNDEWSDKTSLPEFRFERLPKGKYTLKVKAVDLWGNESMVSQIRFDIKAPWYASTLAFIIYLVLLIVFILALRSWEIRRTRQKEMKEREEREKELIRLRNEKLRNEVLHKSKELANSTMAIIKKNEFLMDLKKTVARQKEELGTRYPDKYYNHLNNKIDRNISSQDDWQLFETNFEQAHEQFLRKIKEAYPDLTPSDLRLCAFLRMNLSSKEIAPLLGISVRGVENHRYRLRKKMGLEHDVILTNVILSL